MANAINQHRKRDGFKKDDRKDGKKKNISLAELRREGSSQKQVRGKSRHDEKRGKGGNRSRRNRDRLPRDPAARKERLDKEMERYWVKGGHKELGKCSNYLNCEAQASLDAELDNYMAKAANDQGLPARAVQEKQE